MNCPASNHIAAAARCSSYLLGKKKTCQVKQDALVRLVLSARAAGTEIQRVQNDRCALFGTE